MEADKAITDYFNFLRGACLGADRADARGWWLDLAEMLFDQGQHRRASQALAESKKYRPTGEVAA